MQLEELLTKFAPGILSGLGSAASMTVLSFKTLTQRVSELEKWKSSLEETIKDLTRGFSDFSERRFELTHIQDELRSIERRVSELEERASQCPSKFVSDREFEAADRIRSEEIAQLRTAVAEIRGLVQGLTSFLRK